MIDIAILREDPEAARRKFADRGKEVDVEALIALDDRRKELQAELDGVQRERKEAASAQDIERGKALKVKAAEVEETGREVREELDVMLLGLPNLAADDVPVGPDESGNVVLRTVGEKPEFDFEPLEHFEIGEKLGVMDFERAAKVSGARFVYLKNGYVKLEMALVQFVMGVITSEERLREVLDAAGVDAPARPFEVVAPPLMVREEVMDAMGRLDPREDKYVLEEDKMVLIGSAEHSLGSMYMGEMLAEQDLPLRVCAYTPAFRREAGSYGKDTKGMLRQHQFMKMEMETFSLPEDGEREQQVMVAIQEYICAQLGLPYEVMAVCTGDMGTPDTKQIDINTWMPGQGTYRETHSADYVGDFQSRRLGTKVKRADGGKDFVHMNDATAFAGRTLLAVVENYQTAEGDVVVPEVLRPMMSGAEKLSEV